MRYLLDTDICIHLRSGKSRKAAEKFAALAPGDAIISVITYGELRYGAEKSASASAKDILARFVELVPVAPLPALAAERYGDVRRKLEVAGEVIGSNDLWIAAQALAEELTLVTANEREFRRVNGLKLENWAK